VPALTKVVSDALGKAIDAKNNLFAYGLDSLKAFKIIADLRECDLSLTIEDIFSNPSINALSGLVKAVENTSDESESDGVQGEKYPATGVQAYWGCDIDFNKKTRGLYVSQDFLSKRVFSEVEFKRRVTTIFKNHPALRSHMFFEDGIPTQTISEMKSLGFLRVAEATEGVQDYDTFCLLDYFDIRESRDAQTPEGDISDTQKEKIENFKKQCMAAMVESETVFALQVAYFQLSEERAAIVLTGNHASVDGTTMNILIEELTAKNLAEEEDCYLDYLKFIGDQNNVGQAINFYRSFLANAEFSALPEIEVEENAEVEPEFRGVTLNLGGKGSKELLRISQQEKVSSVSQILFVYGQALRKTLNKDALIIQILTFGRGIPISGMDRAAGCFVAYIPVVVRKDDTVEVFQKNILKAEQNSFAPLPLIWKQGFDLDCPPKLAPFLISEIFPEIKSDGFVKKITEMDYEKMVMSNFIVEHDDSISIYFHYDANKLIEETFLEVTNEMERLMRDRGFLGEGE
jgi:aryl carrier-like protein